MTQERAQIMLAAHDDFAPEVTFTFAPPVLRIRSDDVAAIARLTAIADAHDRGFELLLTGGGDPRPT